MRKTIIEYFWVVVVILGISVLFYPTIWRQILVPSPNDELVIQGESPVYEFVAETVRQNILLGKNPFTETDKVLFPFGWRYALDDIAPINGFYFLGLRPWLGIHQSFMLIAVLSVVLSGVSMYILLLNLSLKKQIAFVTAVIFAFAPFVSQRIGAHPTYTALYIFTLPTLFLFKIIQGRKNQKLFYTLCLMVILSISAVTNLYYCVMLAMLILVGLAMCAWYEPIYLGKTLKSNWWYLLLAGVGSALLLTPWLLEIYKVIRFEPADIATDRNDIVTYSANLAHFLVPSKYNIVYGNKIAELIQKSPYLYASIENFVYPGLLLITAIFGYIFLQKKLPNFLKPIYWTGIIFFVIALGPTLQIGSGTIQALPLPYNIITYLPYIRMARAPARFVVPAIFLMTIVFGYLAQYCWDKTRGGQRKYWMAFLIMIFVIDQSVKLPPPTSVMIPTKIYQYLADKPSSPVLEIPFSIRDSIKYYGYMHGHWAPYTTLLHNQPIFGIYSGRINNLAFNYLTSEPITALIGNAIDLNKKYENVPILREDQLSFVKGCNFYGVRYVTLHKGERYSEAMADLLSESGFIMILADGDYDLWERAPITPNVTSLKFDGVSEELTFLYGWSDRDPLTNSRWIIREKAVTLMSITSPMQKLVVSGRAYSGKQSVRVFVNQQDLGEMNFSSSDFTNQVLLLPRMIDPGLVQVVFVLRANRAASNKVILQVRYMGLEN